MELVRRNSRVYNQDDEPVMKPIIQNHVPFPQSSSKTKNKRQTLPVSDEDDSEHRPPQKIQNVIIRKSVPDTPSQKVVPGKIRPNHEEVEMIVKKDEQLIYDLVGFSNSQPDPKSDESSNVSPHLNDSSRSEDPNTVEAILYRVIE